MGILAGLVFAAFHASLAISGVICAGQQLF